MILQISSKCGQVGGGQKILWTSYLEAPKRRAIQTRSADIRTDVLVTKMVVGRMASGRGGGGRDLNEYRPSAESSARPSPPPSTQLHLRLRNERLTFTAAAAHTAPTARGRRRQIQGGEGLRRGRQSWQAAAQICQSFATGGEIGGVTDGYRGGRIKGQQFSGHFLRPVGSVVRSTSFLPRNYSLIPPPRPRPPPLGPPLLFSPRVMRERDSFAAKPPVRPLTHP